MGVKDLVARVSHAAAVVPRLWSSSLRAGTGPAGAARVLRISEAAARSASFHGRGVPGRTNAIRHFVWQALLTARFDRATAEAIASDQERGTPAGRDSAADRRNNAAGQDYGLEHAVDLRAGPLADAVTRLVPVALSKWDSDELVWVRPH